MYGDQTGERGEIIIPSARPSIHRNCPNCQFQTKAMGKYGLRNCNRTENFTGSIHTSPNDQGIDVVDNAMSKFAKPSSPVLTIKERRKSVNIPKQNQYTDESDSDLLLSKSVPAILPSYYSDESYDNFEENNGNRSAASSENTSAKLQMYATQDDKVTKQYNSYDVNISSVRHNQTNSPSKLHISQSNANQSRLQKYCMWFISLIGIIGIAIYFNKNFNILQDVNTVIYDETRFQNEINHLGEKYRVNDNSILQVQTGISSIFQRQDTGSFIFAYNNQNPNFNPLNFDNFMDEIASATAQYLRNGSKIENHVTVDSLKLDMKFHNELIEEYREDVSKTGVMLVKDMDKVPSSLAMAFHYYCDEFNPLIKRSAIFFTLNLASCSDQRISHANIEKCLEKKWDTVPKDNIRPLLTRVVSVLIDVTSVF